MAVWFVCCAIWLGFGRLGKVNLSHLFLSDKVRLLQRDGDEHRGYAQLSVCPPNFTFSFVCCISESRVLWGLTNPGSFCILFFLSLDSKLIICSMLPFYIHFMNQHARKRLCIISYRTVSLQILGLTTSSISFPISNSSIERGVVGTPHSRGTPLEVRSAHSKCKSRIL